MKPASLRARLVLLTTSAVAVVWLATAVVTWRAALHEIEELLDHAPASQSHMREQRRELAHEIAEHLLMPMVVALPGLAVVLVVAVGLALRPLRRLADDVGARGPDRLTPIATSGVPREILPLAERLNALFAGIERSLDNERRFTADASHELRTPLAALKAQAQVALGAADSAERTHALGQIVAGCDRATRLVAQLLTLARLDAEVSRELQPVSLRPLAEAVLAEAAGEAIARDCELSLGEHDACVRGDAELLQAALRNLVENALRHGGARRIHVGIDPDTAGPTLAVADDGSGIPLAEREAVQRRFGRGSGAGSGGSGVGLSIVARIAELHGAGLEIVDGPEGRGVAIRLRFPPAK